MLLGGSSAIGKVTAAIATLGPAVVAGGMLFLFVIVFTTLWLSYGWFAGLRWRALERRSPASLRP